MRNENLRASQKTFFAFPHLVKWASEDLICKHPTQENMWRYRGRTDDIIVLLNGSNLNPLLMEGIVIMHPKVVFVILPGTGKSETARLIEVINPLESLSDSAVLLEELWRTIMEINDAAQNGRVSKDKVISTTKDKPMLRAGK